MKHTAGPFSISGVAGDNHIMARDKHGERVTVAIVTGWSAIEPAEFEANKVLFAAAPELLEALEVISESEQTIPICPDEIQTACEFDPGLANYLRALRGLIMQQAQQARSALAKARGEQ